MTYNSLFGYIILTQDQVSIVDKEDELTFGNRLWYAHKRRGSYYAASRVGQLHRLIMKCPAGMVVDHINGNTLDNRKANLRVCLQKHNTYNRRPNKKGASDYKGVSWHIHQSLWAVSITADKKTKHLGYFKCENQAALIYNEASLKYHGKYGYQNIIKQRER
jgi:hypothetical protein